MSLSIGSSTSVSSVSSLLSSSTRSVSDSDAVPQDETKISNGAKLMQQLDDLSESDPEKFKEVTANIAKQLQEAADSSDSEEEKKRLTEMSKKFSEASESGKMPEPPKPHEGGHMHGGGGRGGYPPGPPPDMSTVDSIISDALSS